MYIQLLDMLGTAVFAVSGIIVAGRHKMDPIGALVLGIVTAIGGGTVRDLLLHRDSVFWIADPTDLFIAMSVSLFAFLILRLPRRLPRWIFPTLDAVGLAVFVGIGVNTAIDSNTHGLVAIGMGVITGVGGGIIRDIMANEVPMVFRTDIYATACIIGGAIHTFLYQYTPLTLQYAMTIGIVTTLTIRLAAIYWRWKLPTLSPINEERR